VISEAVSTFFNLREDTFSSLTLISGQLQLPLNLKRPFRSSQLVVRTTVAIYPTSATLFAWLTLSGTIWLRTSIEAVHATGFTL
jgi:hypothetical protein